MLLLCRLVHLQQPFQNSTAGVEFSADATMAYNMLICTDADRPTHYNVAKTFLLLHFYPKAKVVDPDQHGSAKMTFKYRKK